MKLSQLHEELSKNGSYKRQSDEIGDRVEIAIHCLAIREELGITQKSLAHQAGVTLAHLRKMEHHEKVPDDVVSSVAHVFREQLIQRGVTESAWIKRESLASKAALIESLRTSDARPVNRVSSIAAKVATTPPYRVRKNAVDRTGVMAVRKRNEPHKVAH